MIVRIVFWILLLIILYAYLGYGLILFFIVQIKRVFYPGKKADPSGYEPEVCLFVTAYNEKDYIKQKIENTLQLDYPKEKIQYIWVTDGSDDGTPDIIRQYDNMEVFHRPERMGKMHAMNRGMKFVKKPVVIFSDTNTLLNKNAIREIAGRFSDPKTGCVAGEKWIVESISDVAAAAGEGIYWRYESWIKKMDAELNSAVGAVGELFAIRTELFEEVETDTILDDFIISLRIAGKGYRIDYTSDARAEETASLNVKEELKRKIRIAAGGMQTFFRLKSLLNPLKYGLLTWQYISHKVIRWTLAPVALFMILPLNFIIVLTEGLWNTFHLYSLLFYAQVFLYLMALIGWFFENRKLRFKMLFIPFYFVFVNYAAVRGMYRYFRGKQPASWEKSKRAPGN
ncbi:MAG: glycosyltransferase family 2 protein [Prolixibacteraceae bacterium]|nr:glycosyltransferase family 2 protein [Prolixibacteraceae bacterium]